MAGKIYVNQPYTIQLSTGQNCTTATSVRIRYKTPSGTVSYLNAALVGGDNTSIAASVTSTINNASGQWEFRSWLVFPGDVGSIPGLPVFVNVEPL